MRGGLDVTAEHMGLLARRVARAIQKVFPETRMIGLKTVNMLLCSKLPFGVSPQKMTVSCMSPYPRCHVASRTLPRAPTTRALSFCSAGIAGGTSWNRIRTRNSAALCQSHDDA